MAPGIGPAGSASANIMAYQYNISIPSEIQGFIPISYDIPPPKRMRERFDFFQSMAKDGDIILVDTPDLYEYANDLDTIKNKDEF